MNFECVCWVVIEPQVRNGEVVGARIGNVYRKAHSETIKLSISVPESFFQTPEIQVMLNEREPELIIGHELGA